MDFKFSDLAAPFNPDDIEWRAGATNKEKTKALALAYITSRAVMNRLDEVCGPQNWQDDYRAGPDGGVLAGIGIRVGDEWIWKWDGAENSQIEAVKGGISDAFKRAAVKWGIGRYLYELDGVWVKCEESGRSVRLTEKPQLPAWAQPQGTSRPATVGNGNRPATPEPMTALEQAKAMLVPGGSKKGQSLDALTTDELDKLAVWAQAHSDGTLLAGCQLVIDSRKEPQA